MQKQIKEGTVNTEVYAAVSSSISRVWREAQQTLHLDPRRAKAFDMPTLEHIDETMENGDRTTLLVI